MPKKKSVTKKKPAARGRRGRGAPLIRPGTPVVSWMGTRGVVESAVADRRATESVRPTIPPGDDPRHWKKFLVRKGQRLKEYLVREGVTICHYSVGQIAPEGSRQADEWLAERQTRLAERAGRS